MAKPQDMSISKLAKEGFLTNNTLFVQMLGTCPALATTTSAVNGLGMGLSTAAILIFSNLLISLIRNIIPRRTRIACYVVVVSGFVTMLEMFLKAYIPALDKSLGLFIPLIVVNCIIFARVEAFAAKNGPIRAVLDGVFTGLGFAFALFALGSVREIIGAGSFMGQQVFAEEFAVKIIVSPPGAFITLGIIVAAFRPITAMLEKRAKKEIKEIKEINEIREGAE